MHQNSVSMHQRIRFDASIYQTFDAAIDAGYRISDAAIDAGYRISDAVIDAGCPISDAAIDAGYPIFDATDTPRKSLMRSLTQQF